MRQSSIKIFILLQVVLYLLGGHATAHGLAWCLSANGHAHVETAAGCASKPDDLSCTTSGFRISSADKAATESHSGSECRHLPVTSPHAASVASTQKVAAGSVVAILPAGFNPTLRFLAAAVYLQTPLPVSVELPRTVALVSLQTIILVI